MGFNEIDQDDRVAHDCVVKEKWYMGFNFSFFLSLQKKKIQSLLSIFHLNQDFVKASFTMITAASLIYRKLIFLV